MNWTTTSMESGDNQAQIRDTNMYKLTVWGGISVRNPVVPNVDWWEL